MSLPARLEITDLSAFSAPYLSVPTPPADSRVVSNVAPDRKRIGFVWRGNPQHKNDHRRSLPILEFAHFLPATNADWISLQVGGDVGLELNHLSLHLETLAANQHPASDAAEGLPAITNAGGQFEDFFDTAQTTLTTDRVITVDTAVAHLAGALGHPTDILIPDPPDWRWGLKQTKSIWFSSVKTNLILKNNQNHIRSTPIIHLNEHHQITG
jgi:hypothetical protein